MIMAGLRWMTIFGLLFLSLLSKTTGFEEILDPILELEDFLPEYHSDRRHSKVSSQGRKHISPKGCMNNSEILRQITASTKYNKHKIPPVVGGGPVVVKMETWVQAISAISDITSDFQSDVYMSERWMDPGLRFDYLKPCNTSMTLSPERLTELWTPHTCFVNSKTVEIHSSPFKNVWVMLFENGTVWTNYRISVSGPCQLDLKAFPMDELECQLTFESYNYNVDEVRMMWYEDANPVELLNVLKKDWMNHTKEQAPTAEWIQVITSLPAVQLADYALIKLVASQNATEYPAGYWDELTIHFHFKRKYGWYILQAYLPSYLTICISWISFYLGSGIAARTLLGVNSMLALTFQFGNIIQNLPRVSYVKAIDVWMLSCIMFVFCSLLELAFVGYLASRENRYKRSRSASRMNVFAGQQLPKRDIKTTGAAIASLRAISILHPASTEFKDPPASCSPKRWTLETVDRTSAIVFPLGFVGFNLVYWWYYACWIHLQYNNEET